MGNSIRYQGSGSGEGPQTSSTTPTMLNDHIWELYKPTHDPSMDILFFHGLQLNDSTQAHLSTWTCGDGTGQIWPSTWLAEEFPKANIFSVSYGLLWTAQGRLDPYVVAENLISAISWANIGHRPIVLVGHCFGGLVIKSLCIVADRIQHRRLLESDINRFLYNVGGVFFYGTPHRGCNPPFSDLVGSLLAFPLLTYVKGLSENSARLDYEFNAVLQKYRWHTASACESLPTSLPSLGSSLWGGFRKFKGVVVPEASSRHGDTFVIVNADHFTLCKPEARTSSNFQSLKTFLQGIQPKRNGEITGDEVTLEKNHNMVTVEAGDRDEQLDLRSVGQNPESELPKSDQTPSDQRVVPKSPWTKGNMLGAGSFGTVYEAVDSVGIWFAVKEVPMVEQDKQAQQCVSQLMQEIELLSHFKHDNIVQYLGTGKARGKLYIFLELASKGSLASICKSIKLSNSQISAYTREILKGLKYLHDQRIMHRDIKCANILVDTKGVCKLADFGMARQISSLDPAKSCKGTAYWMAPEVIDPKKTYGPPADIWSLGCSVLEMAIGDHPFKGMEWARVLWIVGHGTAPPIPDELSEVAKDFVKHCFEINPARRPTAIELLEHEFVRQA